MPPELIPLFIVILYVPTTLDAARTRTDSIPALPLEPQLSPWDGSLWPIRHCDYRSRRRQCNIQEARQSSIRWQSASRSLYRNSITEASVLCTPQKAISGRLRIVLSRATSTVVYNEVSKFILRVPWPLFVTELHIANELVAWPLLCR